MSKYRPLDAKIIERLKIIAGHHAKREFEHLDYDWYDYSEKEERVTIRCGAFSMSYKNNEYEVYTDACGTKAMLKQFEKLTISSEDNYEKRSKPYRFSNNFGLMPKRGYMEVALLFTDLVDVQDKYNRWKACVAETTWLDKNSTFAKHVTELQKRELNDWEQVFYQAETVNYEDIKLTKEAKANKQVGHISKQLAKLSTNERAVDYHYARDDHRTVYDLFRKFGKAPNGDLKSYRLLCVAEDMLDCVGENDEGVYEAYVSGGLAKLEHDEKEWKETYLKKDGMSKAMSHRKRQQMQGGKYNIENRKKQLKYIEENEEALTELICKYQLSILNVY